MASGVSLPAIARQLQHYPKGAHPVLCFKPPMLCYKPTVLTTVLTHGRVRTERQVCESRGAVPGLVHSELAEAREGVHVDVDVDVLDCASQRGELEIIERQVGHLQLHLHASHAIVRGIYRRQRVLPSSEASTVTFVGGFRQCRLCGRAVVCMQTCTCRLSPHGHQSCTDPRIKHFCFVKNAYYKSPHEIRYYAWYAPGFSAR